MNRDGVKWRGIFLRWGLRKMQLLEEVADRLYELGFSDSVDGASFLKDAIRYYKLLENEWMRSTNVEMDPYYAKILNKLGFCYLWLSMNYGEDRENIHEALEYFKKAEKIFEKQPVNLYEQLITYQGIIYSLLELEDKRCREYIEKAEKLINELNLDEEREWIVEARTRLYQK